MVGAVEYAERFRASAAMSQRAERVVAGGTQHDSWRLQPFPVYFAEARGPFKWDIDGHRLVDCWMGHGALLFGHGYPPVLDAVALQLTRGTHLGGAHDLEVRWAELVCQLIPSAERVRFTSSGTEATQLALRVARAFTGRNHVVKLDGHFHGWHDEALAHFFEPSSAGLNTALLDSVSVGDPLSVASVAELLADEPTAAVILEPGGGGSGALPWSPDFLRELREVTQEYGTLLIFDEVVSGFRYSPGGVQKLCGVLPDLTVLGKILGGGLPGAAVAGRADVMAVFGAGTEDTARPPKVLHTGTFNANPLSAAAGIAALERVGDGVAQEAATTAAETLARLANEAARANDVDVHLYTQSSIFHVLIGAQRAGSPLGPSASVMTLYAAHPQRYTTFRRALLLEGIDCHPLHGWLSAAHDTVAVYEAAAAFDRAFRHLRRLTEFER
jgi:glutamate-1-semialdehyde 2,1-aminomutase